MTSRLPNAHPSSLHHGLIFQRGLRDFTPGKSKSDHLNTVATLAHPSGYQSVFGRWQVSLNALRLGTSGNGTTEFARLHTTSRLVVGLGTASVVETSIALHRIYGVPYIPGSALKGVARRFARQALGDDWSEGSNAFNLLFGRAGDDDSFRGLVTFHDALPHPGRWTLHPDTITTHHPQYYTTTSKDVPGPSDGDDPNPVPFLAVTGEFLLPLTGPMAWVQAAARILRLALRESGVGAKTYIGYGRMDLVADWLPEETSQEAVRNTNRGASLSPATRPTKEVRVDRFAVHKGNTQEYATATIKADDKTMNIIAAKNIEGIEAIADRKDKGPAMCTVVSVGGNNWHVVSLRLLEK